VAIRITNPDPYRDTDNTCIGRGMQCPSASSFSMQLTKTGLSFVYHFKIAKLFKSLNYIETAAHSLFACSCI